MRGRTRASSTSRASTRRGTRTAPPPPRTARRSPRSTSTYAIWSRPSANATNSSARTGSSLSSPIMDTSPRVVTGRTRSTCAAPSCCFTASVRRPAPSSCAAPSRAAVRSAARTSPRCYWSCSACTKAAGKPPMRSVSVMTPRPSARPEISPMNGDPRSIAAERLLAAEAVLLDFNGTLSLDEDLLENCYAQALRELGLAPLSPDEYAGMLGRSEEHIAAALLTHRGSSPTVAALVDEVAGAYVESCRVRPRIPAEHLELVRALHARGIQLAIVTGTLRRMIEPVLADAQLTREIPVLVTIEDVTRGKPDPEGFRRGLELLGIAADQ